MPAKTAAARSGTKKAAAKKASAKKPAACKAAPRQAAPKQSTAKTALGAKVPAFSRPATGGSTWKLADAAGKKLVLYFYPRDNTPGCTKEGEAFRDLYPAFKKAGVLIVGVSPDTLPAHEKFKEKFGFPFELLADEDRSLCELFGVFKEKSLYGRKFMGVERSTFLIDAAGVLRQEWRKVKVPGHADAVLAAAQAL